MLQPGAILLLAQKGKTRFFVNRFFSPSVTCTTGYRTQMMANLLLFALETNKQKNANQTK